MTSSPKTTISNSPNFSRRVKISLMAFERAFLSMAQTPTRILREEMGIVDVRRARRGAWKRRVYRCAAKDARARPEASPASPRTSGTRARPRRVASRAIEYPEDGESRRFRGISPGRVARAPWVEPCRERRDAPRTQTLAASRWTRARCGVCAHLVEAKDESRTRVASSLSTRNYETVGDRCASSETLFSRPF